MTEQELKDKIADKVYEILRKSSKLQDGKRVLTLNINGINKVAERVAYSLIFLEIGDVSEYKHRAEVAEKAGRIIQRDMARVFDVSNPRICELIANIWDLAKKQAEKELAEEKKDE